MKSRNFLAVFGIPAIGQEVCLIFILLGTSFNVAASARSENIAVHWNNAALQGIRDAKLGSPMASRALAVVHTCMYDAWAAYDSRADGTQMHGALRRPAAERTQANKEQAISYAAYRALADVLPVDVNSVYKPLMKELGYDPDDHSTDIETPAGIGNVACAAVLEFRHHDKSNQLGDLAPGAYSDWTHFTPVNKPSQVPLRLPVISPIDPNHWQPLMYVNASGEFVSQRFIGAQWGEVTPFALSEGDKPHLQAQCAEPAKYGTKEYEQQAEELVGISAGLTDRQKMMAEYWENGPNSERTPGNWNRFAQYVSARDHSTLDNDVRMFFVLNNALLDAGIAAWATKRTYDSIRPITAIPLLFRGKRIRGWGGPGNGTMDIDGSRWTPYQPTSAPTPPSPDYVSSESTFSAAAARILQLWTGSDGFGDFVSLPAGSSKIEPGITPRHTIVLRWKTFSAAAKEAGDSQAYGGIHFRRADLDGRELGRLIALQVWTKAQAYFSGAQTAPAVANAAQQP